MTLWWWVLWLKTGPFGFMAPRVGAEMSEVVSCGLPHRQFWVSTEQLVPDLHAQWLAVDSNLLPSGYKAQNILLHYCIPMNLSWPVDWNERAVVDMPLICWHSGLKTHSARIVVLLDKAETWQRSHLQPEISWSHWWNASAVHATDDQRSTNLKGQSSDRKICQCNSRRWVWSLSRE